MIRKLASHGGALYGSEADVSDMVLGPGRVREWRDKAIVLEREGLPKIDPLMGGRYLPAVRRWFDQRNGVMPGNTSFRVSGTEKWPKQKPALPKSTPPVSNGATGPAANVFPFGSPPKGP